MSDLTINDLTVKFAFNCMPGFPDYPSLVKIHTNFSSSLGLGIIRHEFVTLTSCCNTMPRRWVGTLVCNQCHQVSKNYQHFPCNVELLSNWLTPQMNPLHVDFAAHELITRVGELHDVAMLIDNIEALNGYAEKLSGKLVLNASIV